MVALENTIRNFERNETPTEQVTFSEIQEIISMTLGFRSDTTQGASSSLASKTVYNQILQQTKRNFPDKSIEERGNKAYILWRYLLSEPVRKVDVATTKPTEIESPVDHIGLINQELDKLLKKTNYKPKNGELHLDSDDKVFNLLTFLEKAGAKKEYQKLSLLVSILHLFESQNHLVFEEAFAY